MVGGFAGCAATVVATTAVSSDLSVIEGCREPASSGMTAATLGSGHNMVHLLAGGGAAIVATAAVAGDLRVIHVRRDPAITVMAATTLRC